MINETFMLFGEEPGVEDKQAHAGTPVIQGVARVLMPNRAQIELRASDLESLLPEGHRARIVWAYVEQADLRRMYAGIRAIESGSGRTLIAPEILPCSCINFCRSAKNGLKTAGSSSFALSAGFHRG